MVDDEQTHVLPRDEAAFAGLARFSGWHSAAALEQRLRATLERVQAHYRALFEDASALGGEKGSLVFTGGEDDPETLETLRQMGFEQPSEVSATIRGWHFGRFAAMRSARAKQMLTEIMPALLAALGRSGDADKAFAAFDRFLSGLSAGVQIFAMLRANPRLLDLIARILGMAPRLAEELSRRPKVLDAVLDTGFFDMPQRAEMASLTRPIVARTVAFEDALDRARIIGKEQMFRIGVGVLSQTVDAEEAGVAFSHLADCLIDRLLEITGRDLARRHGTLPGERFIVLALGKLGGREMTAASDLDLILIYDAAERCRDLGRRQAAERHGIFLAHRPAPHCGAGLADFRRLPLQRRHAAQAVRHQGPGGDAAFKLRKLPSVLRLDVGEACPRPGSCRRRRCRARFAGGTGDPGDAVRSRGPPGPSRRRSGHASADVA